MEGYTRRYDLKERLEARGAGQLAVGRWGGNSWDGRRSARARVSSDGADRATLVTMTTTQQMNC